MFKNKHIIIALLVAPILSILAYVGTDLALSEKPHAAKEGTNYKLVSKSNCRYTSGLCDMANGEFKVKFRSESLSNDELELSLTASFPLEGVKLSMVDNQDAMGTPVNMQAADNTGKVWTIMLPAPASPESWLRVAIQSDGVLYYGDTQMAFVKYETLLSESN
ncbi:hypothetical protein VII00023_15668 [Vibrio ichthyoenteri ATCC 700023]|uniref:Uncharacterized protein n=1 Tax=Vibrio ichthyoenteri ATCC 700023 TaxID=870968 RepID=F9S8C5_9VIBR|nr:hypothetical protein [Vibrio ichthyoenteri]EGU30037.1 hypothetical protein VII00023_15668 [Vibrio ichthyoenteri ATCC 700023]